MYTMIKQHMLHWYGHKHVLGMDYGRISQGYFAWIAGIRKAKRWGPVASLKNVCVFTM